MRRYQRSYLKMETAATDAKIREINPEQGKKDIKGRSFTRSLVLLFVIVAVAATISDLRMPKEDKAQVAFTELVYQQMEAQKAQFWLGGSTAEGLLSQEGWITEVNDDPDIQRAVKRLLQQNSLKTIIVRNWDNIKLEEAARLWDLWQEGVTGQTEEAFIAAQLAQHRENKTLPGLGDNLWLITTNAGEYLLAAQDNLWGIRALDELKHLD